MAAAVGVRDSGGGGLDRASATTLVTPAVWQMVRWNSERKASWRCWRADLGMEERVRAETRGW